MSHPIPPQPTEPPQQRGHSLKERLLTPKYIALGVGALLVFGTINNLIDGPEPVDPAPAAAPAVIEAPAEPEPTEAPEPEPTPEPEPFAEEVADAKAMEAVFPSVVRMSDPGAESMTDQELVDIGMDICARLEEEYLVDIAFEHMLDPTYALSDEGYGALIGAAIPTFCPHHEAELNEFIGTFG